MTAQHPFQCIRCLRNVGPQKRSFVVAAAGHALFVFDALTGTKTSTWPGPESKTQIESASDEPLEPPGKRRKITPPADAEKKEESSDAKSTAQPDNSKNQKPEKQKQKEQEPNVVMFVVSTEGGYVVAATAEDKSVRVFQVDPTGHLSQLSERLV